LAKASAAKAEEKNPARVTPTWIVARKALGLDIRRNSCWAIWSPSSAIFLILLSFSEIMAISVAEKNALIMISTARIKISITRIETEESGCATADKK
jgi:hypothetical protein